MSYDHWLLCIYSWVGAKMDENSIYGKFHWTHKSDFFQFFPRGPYLQEKIENITIITEAGKIHERNDTICDSPSLFSFIVTKSKGSKNDDFAGGSLF